MPNLASKETIALEHQVIAQKDDILKFLVRELPPAKANQASYIADALLNAGARYDRYSATKHEWLDYRTRRKRLEKITKLVSELESGLNELDVITRDDLADHMDAEKIEGLVGSLRFLGSQAFKLVKQAQSNGRRRDLAEERWIFEVAKIYENAFSRRATLSASSESKFYRLLALSRPKTFPLHGKLDTRQIGRALKRGRQ